MDRASVEQTLGQRLRADEYKDRFVDEAVAEVLRAELAERDPPVRVQSAHLLLEWHAECHPDSGSVRYETAEALEAAMGAELREEPYVGLL